MSAKISWSMNGLAKHRKSDGRLERLARHFVLVWILCFAVAVGQQDLDPAGEEEKGKEKAASPGREPSVSSGPQDGESAVDAGVVPESLVTPLIVPFSEEGLKGSEDEVRPEKLVENHSAEDVAEDVDEDVEPLLINSSAPEDGPAKGESPVPAASGGASGFVSRSGRIAGNASSSLAEGVSFSSYSELGYDSNPSFGYGSKALSGADMFLLLGGEMSFRRSLGDVSFDLSYYGDYQRYFGKEDLSNDFHEVEFTAAYEREVLSGELKVDFRQGSGANAYYQSLVDEFAWNLSLGGSYEISALTEVRAVYDYMDRNASLRGTGVRVGASSPSVNDVRGHTGRLEALWSYSPLLKLGPALRMSTRSGDGGSRLNSMGPGLSVDYQVTNVLTLDASTALNWYDYSPGGGSDTFVSAAFRASYRTSPLWSVGVGLGRDLVASSTQAGAFTARTYCRVNYQRQVGRNSLSVGLGAGFDDTVSATGVSGPERSYYTCDLTVGRTVFDDSKLSFFLNYRSLSGLGVDDADSLVLGFSMDHKF